MKASHLAWFLAPISIFAACAKPALLPSETGGAGGEGATGTGGDAASSSSSSSSSGAPGPCLSAGDCASSADACNVGACINGVCGKVPSNELGACDDGKQCTQNDTCQNGVCVGGSTKFCPSSDTCHIGSCDVAIDTCVEIPGNDGASCNDNDACTLSGTCDNGVCSSGGSVDCSFLDGICSQGTCDPNIGCKVIPKADGAACDDNLFCTVNDVCNAGTCAGVPNTCAAPGDVCMIGSCDEAQQTCTAVPGNNGGACDDGNVCTTGEKCNNGLCLGGLPANNGVACDDHNGCTLSTTCSNGACINPMGMVSMCVSGDLCCPAGCTFANDDDCGFAFALSQVVDGKVVTCSSVSNNVTYAECDDLKVEGLYFPNGISCGPFWSMQNSPYTDLQGFCASLTGSNQFEVYYTCDFTMPRVNWYNHVWGTTQDNGYTQHVRCYR